MKYKKEQVFQFAIVFLLLQFVNIHLNGQNEVELRTDGIVVPRIDSAAVSSPSIGQVIYDTNGGELLYYNGISWQPLHPWKRSGNNISYDNGNVGIGTAAPSEQLELTGNLRLPISTVNSGIIYADTSLLLHSLGALNFFVGIGAGNVNSTGSNNTGVGHKVLYRNTTGESCTAVGAKALSNNTTGIHNTAIGDLALGENSSGHRNSAFGRASLFQNLEGNRNTALGFEALGSNMSGDNNIGVGSEALDDNADGNGNIGIGAKSLATNVSGGNNIAIGDSADVNDQNLQNAIVIGAHGVVAADNSLVLGGRGEYAVNVGIGETTPDGLLEINADGGTEDLLLLSTVGEESGDILTVNNDGNVGIGNEAPIEKLEIWGPTENGSSIVLNNTSGVSNSSHLEMRSQQNPIGQIRSITSDNLNGNLNFRTATGGSLTTKLSLQSNGNVGIGTTNPAVKLEIENNSIDGNLLRLDDSDGRCDHNPESGTEIVSCASDARLKKNVRDAKSVITDLMKLEIRDYEVIASGNTMTGLIAQEVQEVFPEMVTKRDDEYLMVSQVNHWKIIKAIQELKTENDQLRDELQKMKSIILNNK